MSFVHEDPAFDDLLQIVATERRLSRGLVEKDYWVTHVLWALHDAGFDVWFKGGTSLSKGFALIERFSEDLDLKIEPGRVTNLPLVSDWKRDSTKAVATRKAYFEKLGEVVSIPGAETSLVPDSADEDWFGAHLRVSYPGKHLDDLPDVMRPFVRLEVGSARVTPAVQRDMSSFVHDRLSAQGQLSEFDDNRPKQVRCVHPLVTLLEKLDALGLRVPKEHVEPAKFVRHYEDAARIIAAQAALPRLTDYDSVDDLVAEMRAEKQIKPLPGLDHPAFALPPSERTNAIRAAYDAIGPMFWGKRRTLDECVEMIRNWLKASGLV